MSVHTPNPAGSGSALFGLVVGALTIVLSACASSGPPEAPASSVPPAASPSKAPSPTAAPTAPTLSALPSGTMTTLRGTVTEGVESGCVVLVDDSGAVVANLQGWDLRTHPFDSQVEVTGTFRTDMMTTCQQGTPFEVQTAVAR